MILNKDFAEPLEFARLIQTVPEIKEVTKALIGLRYYLERQGAADGFDAMILGFRITQEKL